MRRLDLRGYASGRERGLAHGRQFAGDIRTLVELRIHLACKISGFEREGLLRVAKNFGSAGPTASTAAALKFEEALAVTKSRDATRHNILVAMLSLQYLQ